MTTSKTTKTTTKNGRKVKMTTTKGKPKPQTTTTVTKTTKANPKSAPSKTKASPKAIPAFVRSIAAPWASSPAHVPDTQTDRSGLCRSHVRFEGSALTVGSFYTRSFGFFFPPYPFYSYCGDEGNGALTDLQYDGTGIRTAFSLTGAGPPAVPNLASLFGAVNAADQRAKIRCVGISVDVSYNGTELQRAGKFIAATVPITGIGSVVATTGTYVSPASSALGINANDVTFSTTALRQQANKYTEQRVSDKGFSARWIPNQTPSYQLFQNTTDSTATPTTGVDPKTSMWNQPAGGPGVQTGQTGLFVLVEGDATGFAATNGNIYTFDVTWLWEIIPDDYDSVAYECTRSAASSIVLDKCINTFSNMTVCPEPGNGSAC